MSADSSNKRDSTEGEVGSDESQEAKKKQKFLLSNEKYLELASNSLEALDSIWTQEKDAPVLRKTMQLILSEPDVVSYIIGNLLSNEKTRDELCAELGEQEAIADLRNGVPYAAIAQVVHGVEASVKAICSTILDKPKLWSEFIEEAHHNVNDASFTIKQVIDLFERECASWSIENRTLLLDQLISSGTSGKCFTYMYAAISGSSGSGKSCALIWLGNCWLRKKLKNISKPEEESQHQDDSQPQQQYTLTIYLACRPELNQDPLDYVKIEIEKLVTSKCQGLKWEDFQGAGIVQNVNLVVMMDEVPRRWSHQEYRKLAKEIKEYFHLEHQVVLLVAGTALSYCVTKQSTLGGEVLNIRMMPLAIDRAKKVFQHNLVHYCGKDIDYNEIQNFFMEIPLLVHLTTNQRCAFLAASALATLLSSLGGSATPPGWCRGNTPELLSRVSREYRNLNGMRDMEARQIRTLMLDALALTTLQKFHKADKHEGVLLHSLALDAAERVVEAGLVERTILPDEVWNDGANEPAEWLHCVDEGFEWSMSPAITLMCVSEIVPWISAIFDAPTHFECLVAAMMSILRYGQTGVEWPVLELDKAVPYQGREDTLTKLYVPPKSILSQGSCLINGPQAPYCDLMVPACNGFERSNASLSQEDKTVQHLRILAEKSVEKEALLVQCKLCEETTPIAGLSVTDEYAKMGFISGTGGSRASPRTHDFSNSHTNSKAQKMNKQYAAGRRLTHECFGGSDAIVVFATNARFTDTEVKSLEQYKAFLVEGKRESNYAWQQLYPFRQLVRTSRGSSNLVNREEHLLQDQHANALETYGS